MSTVTQRERTAYYFFFFGSGAAALVYEVVWTRLLGLVFGHTTYAVTTVLAAYMAGLALGSWFIGKRSDRWVRLLTIYGVLEIGIGLLSLVIPPTFGGIHRIYLALYPDLGAHPFWLVLLRFVLALSVMLVPTALMGGTLPLLSRFFVRSRAEVGREVSRLYAVNTFGALAGTLLGGFLLIPGLGISGSSHVAMVLNLAIGGLAILAARRWDTERSTPAELPAPTVAVTQPGALRDYALIGIFFVGAASMICEVAFTRGLAQITGSSTYAFTMMLSAYLSGLALGAWWSGRRERTVSLFPLLAFISTMAILLTLVFFQRLPDLLLAMYRLSPESFLGRTIFQFTVSVLVLFIPAFCSGAIFPLAGQIFTGTRGGLGAGIGRLYAANTVGAIAGSLLGGFVLVPMLGTRPSLVVAAMLVLFVAALGWWVAGELSPKRPVRLLALIGVGCAAFLLPQWDTLRLDTGVSIYYPNLLRIPNLDLGETAAQTDLLFYREGISATVSVRRNYLGTGLKINGKVDASDRPDMATQLLLGVLPACYNRQTHRAAVIGFGSGVTAGVLTQLPDTTDVVCLEIEPAVLEAGEFFRHVNFDVLHSPRCRMIPEDGRNALEALPAGFDLISSEPSNPWIAGIGNLFSVDHFRAAASRLAPGGVYCQWVQTYDISPTEVAMILRGFHEVFPYVVIWQSHPADLILLGSLQPMEYRPERVRRLLADPVVGAAMKRWCKVTSPEELASYFYLETEPLWANLIPTPLNTDDRPRLEFSSPRSMGTGVKDLYLRGDVIYDNMLYPRGLLAPDQPTAEVLLALARTAIGRERVDLLIASVDQPEFPGNTPEGRRCRAELFWQRGNYPAAIVTMDSALAERPKQVDWLIVQSLWYRKMSLDPALAQGRLSQALIAAPDDPAVLLAWAEWYRQNAWWKELVDWTAIPAPDTTQAVAWLFARAEALGKQGFPSAAESVLIRVTVLAPYHEDALMELSKLMLAKGDSTQAEGYLERVHRYYPGNGKGTMELALLKLARGETKAARKLLERAVELNPKESKLKDALNMVKSL